MTTLQTTDKNQATSTDSTIEFRVSRPGTPRRLLKLVGSRYTIGSGVECSVRLDDASVRSTHAVLTRDSKAVRLRAYGAPITVNGRPTTESELYVGDNFLIGEYSFELSLGPISPTMKASSGSLDSIESAINELAIQQPPVAATGPIASEPESKKKESKVVPRRRLSFASAMQIVDPTESAAYQPNHPGTAQEEDASQDVPAIVKRQVGQRETVNKKQEVSEKQVSKPEVNSTASGDELASPERALPRASTNDKSATAELFEQYRAILANERRWQERSKRQIERFRQRERRSSQQLDALRTAHEAAERRARVAEDAVQSLKQQMAELAGRVAAMTSTVMPSLEQRLDQQLEESLVASKQYQNVMDSLRGRLDTLQSALTDVQAETEQIRQQTLATREDQEEFAASTDTLEQALQKMAEDYQAERAEAEAKVEQLRQNLYQTSLKLSDLTGQLEETRQNGHGLGALVQQLRSSLHNSQSEAQRFATTEQIEEATRLLKANEQRISQLTEEYDSQSSQLQQECEALRQRLEESEHLANKAIAAASDALNEAIEQRHLLENLSEQAIRAVREETADQPPIETTFDSTTEQHNVDGVESEPINNFGSGETAQPEYELNREQPDWDATYIHDSPIADQADIGQVSWHDETESEGDAQAAVAESKDDVDGDVDDSEPPASMSQSAFHLPLEIEPPASASRIVDASIPRPAATNESPRQEEVAQSSAAQADEQDYEQTYLQESPLSDLISRLNPESASSEEASDEYVGSTYQYDPDQDENFGSFRYENTEDAGIIPSESSEQALNVEGEESNASSEVRSDDDLSYEYNATVMLDAPLKMEDFPIDRSLDEVGHQDDDEPKDQVTSSKVSNSSPRSAAEILASLGISLDDSEDGEQEERDEKSSGEYREEEYREKVYQEDAYSSESADHSIATEATSTNAGESANATVQLQEEINTTHAESGGDEEDDDSIEAYMNRLLRRVQGQSESEPAAKPTAPRTQVVEPKREPVRQSIPEPEEAEASTSKSEVMNSPYVPRSQAPERNSNLAAMRELANSSARTAIAASARKKMSNDVLFKYALFGMGLLAGGAVLMGTRFEVGPWMVIAVCCFGLAGFFLFEGVALSRQLNETAEATEGQLSEN